MKETERVAGRSREGRHHSAKPVKQSLRPSPPKIHSCHSQVLINQHKNHPKDTAVTEMVCASFERSVRTTQQASQILSG